jgi:hypothetical protein
LSEQLQLRSGTATQVAAFTPAAAEVVVDSTNNRMCVGDGATAGGWAAAKLGDTGGMMNRFRNGTMDIWQRGTSGLAVGATTAFAYTADGWMVAGTYSSGAGPTVSQAGGRLRTKASLQVTGAANVTDVQVKQRIESYIAAALCSQTVTIQAQVYNNTGAAITPTLTVNRPSAQDNYASVTADVSTVSLQSCASGAWTQVAYTFAANAASYNGLEILFDFGNNFSTTGKDIQITEADIRVTPGVATGLASVPPPPELRPIATEIPFCQRYFWTSYGNGVAPADGNAIATYSGAATTTTTIAVNFILSPVQMRAAPAMTYYRSAQGGTAGQWDWLNSSGTYVDATSTLAGGATNQNMVQTNMTVSGVVVGTMYLVRGGWAASAEL